MSVRVSIPRWARYPHCGGKGWCYDHVLGFLSLGTCYLLQAAFGEQNRYDPNHCCPYCHGSGRSDFNWR